MFLTHDPCVRVFELGLRLCGWTVEDVANAAALSKAWNHAAEDVAVWRALRACLPSHRHQLFKCLGVFAAPRKNPSLLLDAVSVLHSKLNTSPPVPIPFVVFKFEDDTFWCLANEVDWAHKRWLVDSHGGNRASVEGVTISASLPVGLHAKLLWSFHQSLAPVEFRTGFLMPSGRFSVTRSLSYPNARKGLRISDRGFVLDEIDELLPHACPVHVRFEHGSADTLTGDIYAHSNEHTRLAPTLQQYKAAVFNATSL